jgi:hypothetical protein
MRVLFSPFHVLAGFVGMYAAAAHRYEEGLGQPRDA